MANTFPSAGNVGIGTTTPLAPLHIQSGSALLALFQGNPAGSERAYIQLTSSNSNYTWQISDQDAAYGNTANGLAFIETTLTPTPTPTPTAIRVYFQQGGNVGVGLTNPASARFAVANSGGTSVVQVQASGSVPGTPTFTLGYGGTYDGTAIGSAGYAVSESPFLSGGLLTPYAAVLLNPFGGAVAVGSLQTQYLPADIDPSGKRQSASGQGTPRFSAAQYLLSGSAECGFHQLYTEAAYPSMQVSGKLVATATGGVAGGSGTGSIRAICADVVKVQGAQPLPARISLHTVEIGVHSSSTGNALNQNVGLAIESSHGGFLPAGVRNDVGLYVTGADGWYQAMTYDDGTDMTAALFQLQAGGAVYAAGGDFFTDASGSLATNGTLAAVDALASPPGLFYVDTGGNVYATSYTPSVSSREAKKAISRISAGAAGRLLDELHPIKFRYKRDDSREHLGFLLEQMPRKLAPSGLGPSAFDLAAVLTRVYKEQARLLVERREEAARLAAEIDSLSAP